VAKNHQPDHFKPGKMFPSDSWHQLTAQARQDTPTALANRAPLPQFHALPQQQWLGSNRWKPMGVSYLLLLDKSIDIHWSIRIYIYTIVTSHIHITYHNALHDPSCPYPVARCVIKKEHLELRRVHVHRSRASNDSGDLPPGFIVIAKDSSHLEMESMCFAGFWFQSVSSILGGSPRVNGFDTS
jgi:hypothetical protein